MSVPLKLIKGEIQIAGLRIFGAVFLAILIMPSPASSGIKNCVDKGEKFSKTSTIDDKAAFLINNIFNYYSNNGNASYNTYNGGGGIEWPKGSRKTAIFEDGLVWAGYYGTKTAANLRCGGSTYRHGLQAGRILNSGLPYTSLTASNPGDAAYHTYRVRPDINPTKTFADVQKLLEEEEVSLLSRDVSITAQTIYTRYIDDWNQWPAAQGAPFEDKNGNGTYEPAIDVPGVPGADQTLWHVSNDLDSDRMKNMYGSNPIGLEYQRTIWGYRRAGALGNTVFTRHKIINKSDTPLDSAFLSQWSDPDLGDASDDFVGCDTILNMGYVYNAHAKDKYYGDKPPAAGYDFLQGPIIASPGDSGIFNNQRRYNVKNLGMSAFNFFFCGNASYTDPIQGSYAGTGQWYNLMNGKTAPTGTGQIDLTTGLPTKFGFSGDPTTGKGWIEGSLASCGDRRLCMVTGPFTLMPGDTQEVVVGFIISQGYDRLSSITALKRDDAVIQLTSNSLFKLLPPPQPEFTVAPTFSSPNQTQIKINVNAVGAGATSINVALKQYNDNTLTSVQLFDDGIHNDGAAGDGIFSNTVNVPQQSDGLYASATVRYSDGRDFVWEHVVDEIATIGPIQVLNPTIVSDALNSDGIINYGEDIRFIVAVSNQSSSSLSNVYSPTTGQDVRFGDVPGLSTKAPVYNPKDPSTYFSFTVPDYATGTLSDTVSFSMILRDSTHNRWNIPLLKFKPVAPSYKPYQSLVTTNDNLAGNFEIRVVNPKDIKNHVYVITGVDSINANRERGFTLVDSTDNYRVILQNQPLSDTLGHTAPVVEGFKVLRGTVDTLTGYKGYTVVGTRRFSGASGEGYSLEGFNGAMGNALDFWGIGVDKAHLRSVKLKLVAADTAHGGTWTAGDPNSSAVYRFVRGAQNPAANPSFAPFLINPLSFGFQDYRPDAVPFSAWDLETTPPTRLAIAIAENNVAAGIVDGKWWAPVAGVNNYATTSAREWFFIMSAPYGAGANGTDNTAYHTNLASDATLPLMWVSLANRRANVPWAAGDEFDIYAWRHVSSKDRWSFNPTILMNGTTAPITMPKFCELSQNYPNPFNSTTTIQYALLYQSIVKIQIFNVLGQEIAELVNNEQEAGYQSVIWNAHVASGMYFYRIEVTETGNPNNRFVDTKKMVLLK